jgi:hypothetical protein
MIRSLMSNFGGEKAMKQIFRYVVFFAVVLAQQPAAMGALTAYTDESAFLAALETVFREDFEGNAWDGVRSTIDTVNSATSVTSQGITWSSSERVTTGMGAGRSGYGIYSFPHGIPDSLMSAVAQPLIAAGGWFMTNTPPAQINFIIDDTLTADFDDMPIDGQFSFRGVISTDGFQKIEFKEIEGTPGDQKYIFADDFTFSNAVIGDNLPPTANAGPDQTVLEGTLVMLDGSASSDPDDAVASFMWDEITTIGIPLSNPASSQPTFTAPLVGPSGLVMTFQLTVTDMFGLQDTDTVSIIINDAVAVNQPPIAGAGPDQTVEEGSTVTLDGTASTDAEAGIASYLWSVETGTDVTLSDATLPSPTFVAPPVGANGASIVFSLLVVDQGGLSDTDEVTVTVTDSGVGTLPADMIPLTTPMGDHLGIKVLSGGDLVSVEVMDPADISDMENRPDNMRFGLIDMRIKTDVPGGTAVVEIALPVSASTDEMWFKYDDVDGWRDYSANAVFNASRDRIVLTLTDGGIGDSDNTADGFITDPSGIGSQQPSGRRGDGGCFISTLHQ